MTTAPPPGHAWQGDWRQRIAEGLAAHGAPSATAFAEAHPAATILELAGLLAPAVAAIQLQWVLMEEAAASGDDAIARYARDLLARELRRKVPAGWDHGDDFKGGAFGAWSAALPDEYEATTFDVWEALVAARPQDGWVPSGADDPVLVDVFRRCWRGRAAP